MSVGCVETHCSVIFLVGNRAYKLKRAIAFSSLDYRTLPQREAACRAELRLNRRTAPELYLDIKAIRRTGQGGLTFGDDGEIVDWVVVMRRFDEADLLDRLAVGGRLTPRLTEELADELARFHGNAEPMAGFGGADGMRLAIERNHRDQKSVAAVLGHAAVASLYGASLNALEGVAALLDRRRDEGRVRSGHGDLRLANICMLDGRPTLFDGIEFSDQVSCVDVLFDLSFLLMDLHQRGHELLANILLNRYLDIGGDIDGLAALPLMLSVRAATRAYTHADAIRRQTRQSESLRHAAAAQSHQSLAESVLAPTEARLIAIGGVGGIGKRALAHGLAATFRPVPGARVLHSGMIRRRLLKVPHGTRLPASAYDETLTERVFAGLAEEAGKAFRAGFPVIIDADFMQPVHREAIGVVAAGAGVPFVGLWTGSHQDLRAGGAAGAEGWHVIKPSANLAAIPGRIRQWAHAMPPAT